MIASYLSFIRLLHGLQQMLCLWVHLFSFLCSTSRRWVDGVPVFTGYSRETKRTIVEIAKETSMSAISEFERRLNGADMHLPSTTALLCSVYPLCVTAFLCTLMTFPLDSEDLRMACPCVCMHVSCMCRCIKYVPVFSLNAVPVSSDGHD